MAEPTNSQTAIKAARSAMVDRLIFAALALVVLSSAVATKRFTGAPMLAAIEGPSRAEASAANGVSPATAPSQQPAPVDPWGVLREYLSSDMADQDAPRIEPVPASPDASIRYYDGRAIRPAKRMWMTVTAYSPDARSCGKWADGKTASMKSVWTNGGCLVAADTSVLPLGSLVSVPGYAADLVVPVLDRGGAIKGPRLDVLYPTHEVAMSWGVQRLPVTVWEFVEESD